MGIKKRAGVSAEFSMASMTDIIFLLLIFFMLTSGLVAPNALNLKMPGTSRQQVSNPDKLDQVEINESGRYFLNGRQVSLANLEGDLGRRARRVPAYKVVIAPSNQAPIEAVAAVMDIALRYDIEAILAAEAE